MSIRAESGRSLKFVARTFELATLSRRHLPSSLTVSPLFPHLPSPFPLPSPLRSSPPPREPSKTTAPTGMHTIASSRAKLSFSFSFSFGLLMSNDFQVFCSRATPASSSPWPLRARPATTSLRRATLTWRSRHGVVREARRLGLGRHVTRPCDTTTSQAPPMTCPRRAPHLAAP